jgi:hypothetical protein
LVLAAALGQPPPAVDLKSLRAKIGELTLENDFSESARSEAAYPAGESANVSL